MKSFDMSEQFVSTSGRFVKKDVFKAHYYINTSVLSGFELLRKPIYFHM